MSIQTPTNRNFLNPVGFDFSLSRLPNIEYFIQSATIPGVSSEPVTQGNPFNNIKYQSDHMTYEDFTITFIVDEDMKSWLEIYKWITGINFPVDHSQYKNLKDGVDNPSPHVSNKDTGDIYSDASLIVYTDKSNSNLEFRFRDLWPIRLSSVVMSSSEDNINYPTAEATFLYQHFIIDSI